MNVFLAPKPRQQGNPPTLGQIKQSFPLPGRYHFRFKTAVVPGGDREKNGLGVWMDCVDDSKSVPTWQSTIVAKVTRIGIDEDDDFEDDEEFVREGQSAPQPAPAPEPKSSPQPPPVQQPSIDIFAGPAPAQRTTHPPAAGSDLLGDFNTSNGNHHQVSSGTNDFLGMTAPTTGPSKGSFTDKQPHQQPPQPHNLHQPPTRSGSGGNSFDKFTQNNGPFGDLGQW